MAKRLLYLLDPLCGWCYGAAPALSLINDIPDIEVELWPTGLFSDEGVRPLDDAFAAHAWRNDQRISALSGQVFSELYRTRILADRNQEINSGPATVALTAVSLTAPEREFDALKAIQHARYVDARDITDTDTLVALLREIGLEQAALTLAEGNQELLGANQRRMERGRSLMTLYGAHGVPTFVLSHGNESGILSTASAYSNPKAFAEQLAAA